MSVQAARRWGIGSAYAKSRPRIADYLGLTTETVSRTLTRLERDQTIAIPSSRRILLTDRAALAERDA